MTSFQYAHIPFHLHHMLKRVQPSCLVSDAVWLKSTITPMQLTLYQLVTWVLIPLSCCAEIRQTDRPSLLSQTTGMEWNVYIVDFLSCRHVLAAMGFFAFFNCYTLRINLSVAIVAMVNSTYLREHEAAAERLLNSSDVGSPRYYSDDQCVASDENTTAVDDGKVRFIWAFKCHCPVRAPGLKE